MDHRPPPRRRVAALVPAALVLLLAGCAGDQEAYPHTGQADGWTQGSAARTVLLYLLLPLAIAGVLMALTYLPGAVRRNRYRPQEGWGAEPVWFAGPSDPVAAVEQADTGGLVRGGAGGSW